MPWRYVRGVFLGHDWESWREVILLTLATLATGFVVGLGAYILQDRPEEVTCAEMQTSPSKMNLVAGEVEDDLGIPLHRSDSVALIVSTEIKKACADERPSHRPVNSDLRGTVRQRVAGIGGQE